MAAWLLNIQAGTGLLNRFKLTKISRLEKCHIVDECHILNESDILEEADEVEGKNVYVLLNLDGSLPFPGKR